MTLIPKSIASDTVIFTKWQYRLRYLLALFFIACIVFVINLILNGVSEGWFGFFDFVDVYLSIWHSLQSKNP